MKSLLLKLTLFLFASIFLISCSNEEEDAIYSKAIIESKINYSPIETEILVLINNYRVDKGLPYLKTMNIISTVAESHSTYMAEVGEANHDHFPERQQKLVLYADAKTVGENVAFGFNSAQSVFNAWLKSESHKKIIEYPEYTHFGISTKTDMLGRNYFTQMFIKM